VGPERSAMTAAAVPPLSAPEQGAPRVRARAPRRLSSGAILPLVFATIAAGCGYEALKDRSAMTGILVTSVAVPTGAPVNATDTRLVDIHASDQVMRDALVGPTQLRRGLVAAVALRAGELLTTAELAFPASGPPLGEMSVAVPAEQAVGGRIGPGDSVDIAASASNGGAYYVAQDLRVVSVAPAAPAGGVLGGDGGAYYVVVSVNKQEALRLTGALGAPGSGDSQGIEVVLSNGEAPSPQTEYAGPVAAGEGTEADK